MNYEEMGEHLIRMLRIYRDECDFRATHPRELVIPEAWKKMLIGYLSCQAMGGIPFDPSLGGEATILGIPMRFVP